MIQLFFTILLFSSLAGGAPTRLLVNGTAAVVGKNLITVEDAYFYRALQRFREGQGDPFAWETGENLRRTVQKMALEEMVFTEMKSFKIQGNAHSEAENVIRNGKTKDKNEWSEILKRYQRSDKTAVERLAKSLTVEHFLERKVETLTPVITEAEAESYFRQNENRFQGSSFESLKPTIVRALRKQRMEKALEDWVHFLRDKYGLSNYL